MVSYQKISQYRVQPEKDVLLHRYCTLFRQSRWLVLSETLRQYMVSNYPTVKEAKICMFADDTQLLNKNEESVEQSFLILSKFEKASGSKINYEKTKGSFIGRLRGKRPRLTNISWISDNIKTLGVFHGYNIDTDNIWGEKK